MDKADCEQLRREIKAVAEKLWALRRPPIRTAEVPTKSAIDRAYGEPAEAYANATLAYRHLEDASMRLGKAIQALDGGASVYDRDQVPKN